MMPYPNAEHTLGNPETAHSQAGLSTAYTGTEKVPAYVPQEWHVPFKTVRIVTRALKALTAAEEHVEHPLVPGVPLPLPDPLPLPHGCGHGKICCRQFWAISR